MFCCTYKVKFRIKYVNCIKKKPWLYIIYMQNDLNQHTHGFVYRSFHFFPFFLSWDFCDPRTQNTHGTPNINLTMSAVPQLLTRAHAILANGVSKERYKYEENVRMWCFHFLIVTICYHLVHDYIENTKNFTVALM